VSVTKAFSLTLVTGTAGSIKIGLSYCGRHSSCRATLTYHVGSITSVTLSKNTSHQAVSAPDLDQR